MPIYKRPTVRPTPDNPLQPVARRACLPRLPIGPGWPAAALRVCCDTRRNTLSWFKVYSDCVYTLQTLREGCKLGVISNAWPYLESLLRLLGLWPYFESVIISAQVGLSKPNPAIYELALRTFGIAADKAIFVDDIPENVVAAEQVGLKGLWLTRRPAAQAPAAYRHLTQIACLSEIIPVALGV